MEFGSAFLLSTPVNPAVDVDEIDETDYSAGVHSAMNKNMEARGDNVCLLDLLDTAGQEEYSAMRDDYTRTAKAFAIVFSITSRSSFEEAKNIYDFVCRYRGTSSFPAVLCANKCDLEYRREVPDTEVRSWASRLNLTVFNTSAKRGINVDDAFIKLVQITPRTGPEYKIAVLGGGGVGKSAIIVRFVLNEFAESYDPTIEDAFRKQMIIPDLPQPIQTIRPSRSKSMSSMSRAARWSSNLLSSLFRWPSRASPLASSSDSTPAPSPTLPSYNEATVSKGSGGRKVRRIPKKDTNILMLNLGSLAPENFDMLEVRQLAAPPPTCSVCSAFIFSSPSCAFCGAKHQGNPQDWKVRQAAEEYTLVMGLRSSSKFDISALQVMENAADRGLVVFCIDISGSMSRTQEINNLQGMWNLLKNGADMNSAGTSAWISRLESIQDAVQVHLDRLESQYPERKVAIITFSSELHCFIRSGMAPNLDSISPRLNPHTFECIEDGMVAARGIRPADWKTFRENIESLRSFVTGLVAGGGTALGPALAVALGLAREHKRESGASTEIFLCTDGASNTGMGSTNRPSSGTQLHGHPFYSQAGEIALAQSAKINIIGIEGEGVALDILGVAAIKSGGVVTIAQPEELRRQIRTASQRRVLATDVEIKLHAPNGWKFMHDLRPGVSVAKSTLTYTLAQIDDETSVGFAFSPAGGKASARDTPRHFQAHVTYTSLSTGDKNVRVLNGVMPTTSDRKQAEAAVEVALAGTYYLQRIAFAANQILIKNMSFVGADVKTQIRVLRDELYASHQLFIRGAQTHLQQEELGNFTYESAKLDAELERMMSGGTNASFRDAAAMVFAKATGLPRSSLLAGSRKSGQVRRRAALK